jgi:hypothetical protein
MCGFVRPWLLPDIPEGARKCPLGAQFQTPDQGGHCVTLALNARGRCILAGFVEREQKSRV